MIINVIIMLKFIYIFIFKYTYSIINSTVNYNHMFIMKSNNFTVKYCIHILQLYKT
jgi:hypothetical protein